MPNLQIWTPRYHDGIVLIAKYKVVPGDNVIEFTKAKHLEGMLFKMAGAKICEYPIDTNGKIPCYAVPFDDLIKIK